MDTGLIKERLRALKYDVTERSALDGTTQWALKWFRHQNALPQSDAVDETLTKALFSEDAAPGVPDAFPYYSMEDPLWDEYPYDAANTTERETVGSSGCGPTSMAMAVSALTGRATLPPVLCDWSNAHGHRDPNGQEGTYDTFFPACAALYGLTASVREAHGRETFDAIARAIDAGGVVISCLAAGSPFTKCGHYSTIQGFEGGRVVCLDPVPRKNELPRYTIDEWLEGGWLTEYIVVQRV